MTKNRARAVLRFGSPRRLRRTFLWLLEIAGAIRRRRAEPRLTVAVDVNSFYEALTGVGWYLHQILVHLADRDDLRLRLYGQSLVESDPGAPRPVVAFPPGPAIERVVYRGAGRSGGAAVAGEPDPPPPRSPARGGGRQPGDLRAELPLSPALPLRPREPGGDDPRSRAAQGALGGAAGFGGGVARAAGTDALRGGSPAHPLGGGAAGADRDRRGAGPRAGDPPRHRRPVRGRARSPATADAGPLRAPRGDGGAAQERPGPARGLAAAAGEGDRSAAARALRRLRMEIRGGPPGDRHGRAGGVGGPSRLRGGGRAGRPLRRSRAGGAPLLLRGVRPAGHRGALGGRAAGGERPAGAARGRRRRRPLRPARPAGPLGGADRRRCSRMAICARSCGKRGGSGRGSSTGGGRRRRRRGRFGGWGPNSFPSKLRLPCPPVATIAPPASPCPSCSRRSSWWGR